MVEELDRDYVRTAIGAGTARIVVARGSSCATRSSPRASFGLRIGYLMGGVVVIEIIFRRWHG